MLKLKFLNMITVAVMLLQAVMPVSALAMTNMSMPDYSPGNTVTISGDNSAGAGFLPGENVHVDVSGPNGSALSCDATADENSTWSCSVTVGADESAAGVYSYTATGDTSGASQSGSFTVTAPTTPTEEPTQEPTQEPTVEPTQAPTEEPTTQPTASPTSETPEPTVEPSPTPVLQPFIRSDKDDYPPGATVILTSGNWQPGEWVLVYVNDNIGQTWSITTNRQADATGSFVYQFTLPNWFVATYRVAATGDISGVATTIFTDSRSINSVTLNGGPSVTVATGASITAAVTVTTDNGGGNNEWRSTGWRISTTSPGSVTCVNTANRSGNGTSFTESFNITAPSTPGTYNAYFIAYSNDTCTQGASLIFTLSSGVTVKSSQTITVNTSAPTSAVYNTNFNVTATASSSLPVAITSSGACSGSGSGSATITMIDGIGTCTVNYNQAGNASFLAAPQVTQTTNAQKANQTITFNTLADKTFGDADFGVSASASSGLTVSLSSQTLSKCTVSGNTVHIVAVGTCTIRASQSGDSNYNAASNVDRSFDIAKGTPTITWANPADIVYNAALSNTQLNATANVPGTFVYSPASGTVLNAGNGQTLHVDFTPTDTTNYNNASKDVTINVLKASSSTVVSCLDSQVYTGSVIEPCTVSVTGVGGLNLTPDPVYANNVNVGTASASYTYAGDANHTGSNGSDTFDIAPASTTTVVSCPVSEIYTGAAIEPCTVSVTGANLSISPDPVYTDNVNAGTATASYTYAGDANHTGSDDSATFEITPASSSVTVSCPVSEVYTGSEIEPCTASYETEDGLSGSLPVNYEDNINVGTATASASYAGDANHTDSDNSSTFQITPASTTTVVTCPISEVYTGSAIEPCTVSVTGANLSLSPNPVYAANINVGTATASYTYAGDDNHTGSDDSATFEITKVSTTTIVSCPDSEVYTGAAIEPCTVSVTGANLSLSPEPVYADNVIVGTATASYTYAGDANHTGSNGSDTFEITKADSVIMLDCPVSVVYDGSAQEPCTATVTGVGGLNESVSIDYSDNTNAGTAIASATYAGDDNHNSSSDSANFEIEKADSVTVLTCPVSVVYSGSAQTPCSANVTGAGGVGESVTVDYTDNTDAGTANASATYAGDANHNSSSDTATFEITPASSSVTVSCPVSEVYTGVEIEPCTASYETEDGLSGSLPLTYEDNINVGTATASANYAGDANHIGSDDTATFEIEKADSLTVLTCPASVVYNGAAQTPCSATVTGAGGLSESVTVVYASNTDSGTATASASFAGDANHNSSNDSTTFEIEKADSVTALTCPPSVIYNSFAQTPCTATVTGVDGLNASVSVDYTNNTDAGTASASATYAGDDNHNSSSDSATFEIEKADSITVLTCPANVVYNGSAQTPCTAAVTGVGGLDEAVSVDYSDNTNAGTASASTTYVGDDNHNGSSDSANFEIEKADSVTVLTCPVSVVYNGSAQEPCLATVTGIGGLNESVPVDYTDNTNAGTASASATYAGDDNHNGSSDSATFEIAKASSSVSVSCTVSETYTGSPIEPCTASYSTEDGLSGTLIVSYEDNTNVGTATASATYPGDSNHEDSSNTATFEITPASSSVTVSCPVSEVYTGVEIEPCTASYETEDGLSDTLTVTYEDNINVGTATASTTYAGDSNHESSSNSTTFEITPASTTTVVTCPDSEVYTGSPLEPCTVSVNGANLNLTPTADYAENMNVGIATASYTYPGDANHTGSNGSDTFEITPAPTTTVVSCPASEVYTGAPVEPCDVSVTGAGGLNLTPDPIYADNMNVGTATASYTYTGDSNHTGSSDSAMFEITPAPTTTVVTCPLSVTYNGLAQTPCSASVTGVGGLSQSLTVNYSNNTNAGTATASASYPGDANHTGSSDSKNFTINKATLTVTADNKSIFFGSSDPAFTFQYSGFVNTENANVVDTPPTCGVSGPHIAVGIYTIVCSGGLDNNYSFNYVNGTLTIGVWTLRGFYQPVDMSSVFNVIKNGSTVPLKFEIFSGSTELTDVNAVRSLTYGQIACVASSPVDEIETVSTGNTALRYDGGQFIYNWKTSGTAGKCYRVAVTTQDGSILVAYFKFK